MYRFLAFPFLYLLDKLTMNKPEKKIKISFFPIDYHSFINKSILYIALIELHNVNIEFI